MKKWILPFLALTLAVNASAQPAPYRGTLLFNLSLDLWKPLSPEEIKKMGLKFLSWDKEASLHYDSLNKYFVYSERGFDSKCLYLVYRGDTVTVRYASVRGIDFHVLAPIPLDRKSYAFDSPVIYDAIHSNTRQSGRPDCLPVFQMCRGCFISLYEDQTEKWEQKERIADARPLQELDWQIK